MRSKSALTGDNEPALENLQGRFACLFDRRILVAASATLDGIFYLQISLAIASFNALSRQLIESSKGLFLPSARNGKNENNQHDERCLSGDY